MAKFYVAECINLVYPMPDSDKVLVKFGKTHHTDAANRFDKSVDDGYDKNYLDWDIKIKFSKYGTDQEVTDLESYWLNEQFPYDGYTKVWVEDYLGVDDRNKYKDNTGITELRLLTRKQFNWVLRQCYDSLTPEEIAAKEERKKKYVA
jgi:hypothetical protein